MDTTYRIELSTESINKLISTTNKVKKALSSEEFNKFILGKCKEVLDLILEFENIASDEKATDYLEGNKTEITKNYVELYNDSEIDIPDADTFFSEYAKQFYPIKLSLAELVEYGTGLVGAQSSKGTGDEWEYMVNQNRNDPNYMLYGRYASYDAGWEWKNGSNREITRGQEGRYIYFQLKETVEEHLDEWVEEYLERILSENL